MAVTNSITSTTLTLARSGLINATDLTVLVAFRAHAGGSGEPSAIAAGFWGSARFAYWFPGWFMDSTPGPTATGSWVWVAYRFTTGANTDYFGSMLDGGSSWTNEASSSAAYPAGDLTLLDGAGNYDVAAIKVWSAVLTDAELTTESRKSSAVRTSGLLHASVNELAANAGVDSGGGSWSWSATGAGTTIAGAPAYPDDGGGGAATSASFRTAFQRVARNIYPRRRRA